MRDSALVFTLMANEAVKTFLEKPTYKYSARSSHIRSVLLTKIVAAFLAMVYPHGWLRFSGWWLFRFWSLEPVFSDISAD